MKRRRFLFVTAAAGLLPASTARAFRLDPVEWRGTALGAAASMTIHHEDRAIALALLDQCLSEIERLEKVFSLYRSDSALVRLNRDGFVEAPPLEMVELLGQVDGLWRRSGGAFDPTVQPLWELYAAHFSRPGANPDGPDVEALRPLLGWDKVSVSADRIALRPGMALTLNGIAQGYVTDRVAGLLRAAGLRHVLLNLGEIAALGPRGDGAGWSVEFPDGTRRSLSDGAVAVSMADGTRFSATCHHLFDPLSGRSAHCPGAVVVQAETATEADGLSTAIATSNGRFTA